MAKTCFGEMFRVSKAQPIGYKGKTILLADYVDVFDGDRFFAKIESCNSQWRQGLWLKVYNGSIILLKLTD